MSVSAMSTGDESGKKTSSKLSSYLEKIRVSLGESRLGAALADKKIHWPLICILISGVLIAVITVTWLWRDQSDWQALYGRQELYNTATIIEVLDGNQVPYRIHPESGQIMVPADSLGAARMQLAVAGQVPEKPPGMELLESEGSFGRSQFVERARYLQGLEGELGRTIINLRPVRNARVHLAIPERTAFIREKQIPSASVYVDLYPGTELNSQQVQAIARLVAGSVPELVEENVSILDQGGNLLSFGDSDDMDLTGRQTTYIRKLENRYTNSVNSMLEAVVGAENLRVQVAVDIDFSISESTAEGYNPQSASIRSESLSSDITNNGVAEGVPGVESNRESAGQGSGSNQLNSSRTIRNYEVDRTVSRTQQRGPQLQRISVAVVLNSLSAINPDQGWNENVRAEMSRLIESAVGIDYERGDQISIGSLPFMPLPKPNEQIEIAEDKSNVSWFDEQPLSWKVGAGSAIALLLLALFLLRRRLKKKTVPEPVIVPGEDPFAKEDLASESDLTERVLDDVRRLSRENPDQIAHILQQWIEGDNR